MRREPNDDFLWDGLCEPDPEVKRLEGLLRQFRSNRPAPDFARPELERAAGRGRLRWREAWRFYRWPRLAAAGATLVMVAAAWLVVGHLGLLRHHEPSNPRATDAFKPNEPKGRAWAVSSLKGAPVVGSSRITGSGQFRVGQMLVTDAASEASVNIGEMGEVEVGPNTRLRLIEASSSRDRLDLERGTIEAAIWAPPGQFVVDTPSAVAVDLGCAYTLHVDDSGAGLLRTTLGWVGFTLKGREAFIPAGAVCATQPGVGPGTPYFDDASAPFRQALTRLDFETLTPEARDAALDVALSQARPRDALSLWHLLSRTEGSSRARVYSRLATLAPPPAGVTREGILAGNRSMLDLWWDSLGYGDTSLWRTFERSWSTEKEPR